MACNLKTCFLSICITLTALSAYAQDKIYKKDGNEIDAKVKSVGEKTVTYKRFDNQDGPEYSILKKDITKIVYQNGSTDVFEGFDKDVEPGRGARRPKEKDKGVKYGKNIFS